METPTEEEYLLSYLLTLLVGCVFIFRIAWQKLEIALRRGRKTARWLILSLVK